MHFSSYNKLYNLVAIINYVNRINYKKSIIKTQDKYFLISVLFLNFGRLSENDDKGKL